MSITKDFERKQYTCGGSGDLMDTEEVYSVNAVSELLAHTRALESMLKKHEFSDEEHWCPECGMAKKTGHDTNCQLAKLLEGTE